WMLTSSACGAGGETQPGVERVSAEPQEYGVNTHQAREAGGSFLLFATSSSLRLGQSLSPASRACALNSRRTWGSAALHPRLYSDARYRGLRHNIRALCKSLGKDKLFLPGLSADRSQRAKPSEIDEGIVLAARRLKSHARAAAGGI